MELVVKKNDLLRELQLFQGIVERKNTIPILANVLMNANLRPTEVDRTGIREITVEEMQAAKVKGQTIRLVCEAYYEDGAIRASVRPTTLSSDDPLALVRGTGNDLILETDMIGYLAIGEDKATPMTTAYGLLVDIVNIARGHYR